MNRTAAYTTARPDVVEMVPTAAMRILDVGCSNGMLGQGLRSMRKGRTVFGVEIDHEFAREAGTKLDGVVCADVNVLDWKTVVPGTQFDCIVFADVLEHLTDPSRHLTEARQRLAPGGCLVISLPNIRHISSLYSIFLRGTFPARDRGIFDRTHVRWFTIGDTKSLVSDLGMSVDCVSYILRMGDVGGGRWNRLVNRLPQAVQRWFLFREFLTYQFCIRATSCS
ncbi:class I SAM-dependent methyltransferase [Massilia psychrophila]|nr:class I SAM-dependent methyltransferase [Massilia psychrophila]